MSIASSVLGTTSSSSTSSTTTTRDTSSTLGKDQFLQLLVTQLKYQDPMNPTDDKEFISQMAQFSSLEQMQNLNASFNSMRAYTLMGKNISATITDEKAGTSSTVSGTVDGVVINGGKSYVTINGTDVDMDNISKISGNTTQNVTDIMSLIGKNIEGTISGDNGGSISVSGAVSGVSNSSGTNCVKLKEIDLEGVDVQIPSNTIAYKNDYLDSHIGKEITVQTTDSTGKTISVKGTLRKWSEGNTGYNVTLEGVEVAINDITGISESESTVSNSSTSGSTTTGS